MKIKSGKDIVNLVGSFKILIWDKKESKKRYIEVEEFIDELEIVRNKLGKTHTGMRAFASCILQRIENEKKEMIK